MKVDYRTRRDDRVEPVGFDEFFATRWPALLRENIGCVQPWLAIHELADLTIEVGGVRWCLAGGSGNIQARPGESESGMHVRMNAEEFSGLVNDLYTPMTFFVGGSLDLSRGDMAGLLDWWLLIRAVVDGRPIHLPGQIDFKGRQGAPLELDQSFQIDDPLEEMRHFLETAGFLHIRGVFSKDEMDAVSADMDQFQARYFEGDERSWWATTGAGERRLVRLQGFDEHSAATRALLADPRFRKIGDISGAGHTHAGLENNAIEALIKPLDVVEGISDLPWHKDCSLGRHSFDCCSLTVGISVTGAGPDSGQLRVIAGSHRALMWPALLADPEQYGLPVVDLPTAAGDITIHLSCTHHMAQAPTARERRVMYTGFRLPAASASANTASRDRISRVREGAYKTVSQ